MNQIEENIPPRLHLGAFGKGKNKPYAIFHGPDRSMVSADGAMKEGTRYWRCDLDHSHSTLHHVMNQIKKGNLLVNVYNLDPKNDEHQQIQNYVVGVSMAVNSAVKTMGIEATVERMKQNKAAQSEESKSAR